MIKALIDIKNDTVALFYSTVTIRGQKLLIKEFDDVIQLLDYLQQENLTIYDNFNNLKLDISPSINLE